VLRSSLQRRALDPGPCGLAGQSLRRIQLSIERAGRDWVERTGRSFIAFRIGYCQHAPGNIPGPHMDHGVWGQQMWRVTDLCQGMERAVMAHDVRFAILNLMSDNPGMRWDIEATRRVIGYRRKMVMWP